MDQVAHLSRLGFPLGRVVISHTDKVTDRGYHREMLSTGVYLCYDQALRNPQLTADLVHAAAENGYEDRIVLGTDGARRSLWATLGGGPGLAWLYADFPDLISVSRDQLFVSNPARWLAADY